MLTSQNPTTELLEPKPITETASVARTEKPVEPTLEQKIKANFYKCDTDSQYIRSDNAQCLDKPVRTQSAVKTPINASQGTKPTGSGWYFAGQCTAWVANKRYVPDGWGDATDWKYHAQAQGWNVSNVPVAGAIGWTYGHVVYVESVDGPTVTISEQNYDWRGSIRTVTVPASRYTYLF